MDVYFIMHLSVSYIVYTVEYGKLNGKENIKRKKQIIFFIYIIFTGTDECPPVLLGRILLERARVLLPLFCPLCHAHPFYKKLLFM